MPIKLLKKYNATRIFLLAKLPPHEKYITQEAVVDESNIYGDILQGSFTENYRNLTHKHLMGLHWTASRCDKASYILKVDDDTVFNLEKTILLLKNQKKEDLLLGYMLNNTKPRRQTQNKWYVTHEEYPRTEYPPYLSGWYYITTPAIASKLCDEAQHHPYFWIDDIFITGILVESLQLSLKQMPNDSWLEYYELLECCLRDMISKSIKCEVIVGPNGNRDNLIIEFNEAVKNCDKWKNCTNRPADHPLKKVCVVKRDRTLFNDRGRAEIEYVRL